MRSLLTLFLLAAVPAWASIHPGGFPPQMSPTGQLIDNLYNIIFIIIAVIAFTVAVPIGYVLWRFRRARNPRPATFSHSTTLELLWTIIPALICIFISYESYFAMVKLRTMPADGMNVEVVGYQFGWDFYYPDASENGTHVKFDAPSQPDAALSTPGHERYVPTLVVPTGRPIILHITSADVIHSFYNPHLGFKIDAFPGRINYVWFEVDQPGTWLGQCAELCGANHADMFFRVKAVSPAEFADYIKARRVDAGLPPVHVESPTTIVSGTPTLTPVAASVPGTAPLVNTTGGVTATALISGTPGNLSPSMK
jgi:cytochrome c oxidase subunit 2